MDEIFSTNVDWYKNKRRTALFRRTVIALILLLICIFWWLETSSIIPIVIVAGVILERLFEFASIPYMKKLAMSLSVTVSEQGLVFRSRNVKRAIIYPWPSLKAKYLTDKKGNLASIEVEDLSQKGSKMPIEGFSNMENLKNLIEKNIEKS